MPAMSAASESGPVSIHRFDVPGDGEPPALPPLPDDFPEMGDGCGFWEPMEMPELGANLEELLKFLEELESLLQ